MLHRMMFNYRLLFNARLFDPWLLDAWFFGARLLHVLYWSGLGCRFAMHLSLNLGFALHLQPVFFQLLRVNRLFRTLVLLRVFRTALATVWTIAPVAAATSTAATIAASTARFFSILPRRTVAVLRTRIGPLLHGWPRLLLLRARVALLLIGPPLALGTLCLRLLSLLRNFRARSIAVRPLRPGLLLLWGTLVASWLLVAFCIAIAALLVRPAAASVALGITRAIATSATSITSATSTASATAMLVPVARFVVATFGALRPRGTHAWFVSC